MTHSVTTVLQTQFAVANYFIRSYTPYIMQVACAGAVVAAGFSLDKILDINNTQRFGVISLQNFINSRNGNLRLRTEAAAGVTVAAGIIIPVEIIMIFLRLFKINLGTCGRLIVVLVRNSFRPILILGLLYRVMGLQTVSIIELYMREVSLLSVNCFSLYRTFC